MAEGGVGGKNRVEFAAGTALFHEGQDADAAFLVIEGKVEVRKQAGADHRVIATLSNGDVVGEMALFERSQRTADAIAIANTRTFRISREDFEKRLDGVDPIMKRILTIIVTRLRETTAELARLRRDSDGG